MSKEIPDSQAEAVLKLFPFAQSRERPLEFALQTLIDQERGRRGAPDPVTGGYSRFALDQGALLNAEFDLATMGHWESWPIGAVICDLEKTIRLNQRYGFAITDGVLRAIVQALQARFPTGKTVRLHGDCFATLLPPSSEVAMSPSFADELQPLLRRAVTASLPDDGEPAPEVSFTIALLQLRIADPPNGAILGPLVAAECDRAFVRQRTRQTSGVQERRLVLHGSIDPAQF